MAPSLMHELCNHRRGAVNITINWRVLLMVIVVCLAIVIIYQFVSAEMQPFIYFQF